MKTDLEAMQIMAKKDQDISVSTELLGLKVVKAGGKVTIATDSRVAQELMHDLVFDTGKYICALYVINREQLNRAKND